MDNKTVAGLNWDAFDDASHVSQLKVLQLVTHMLINPVGRDRSFLKIDSISLIRTAACGSSGVCNVL